MNRVDWFSKHVDTVIVIGAIISSMLWMNSKFGEVEKRFGMIDKDITIIKTTLILKNIMPEQLANKEE